MTFIRLVTFDLDQYNPYQFGESDSRYKELEINRAAMIERIVRELHPDILLTQGIVGYDQEQIEASTKALAAQTDLNCQQSGRITAQKSDYFPCGNGILWGPGVTVLAWRLANVFWHPMGVLSTDIGGQMVNHLCYSAQSVSQLRQAGGDIRTREAAQVAKLTLINPLSIVGGNWNSLSASRRNRQSGDGYWDTPPRLDRQLNNREVEFVYNRTPGDILERHGLLDVMPQMGNVYPTTHSRHSHLPLQRLDRFYTTRQMLPHIRSVEVITTPDAASASSHFPVLLTYEIR